MTKEARVLNRIVGTRARGSHTSLIPGTREKTVVEQEQRNSRPSQRWPERKQDVKRRFERAQIERSDHDGDTTCGKNGRVETNGFAQQTCKTTAYRVTAGATSGNVYNIEDLTNINCQKEYRLVEEGPRDLGTVVVHKRQWSR